MSSASSIVQQLRHCKVSPAGSDVISQVAKEQGFDVNLLRALLIVESTEAASDDQGRIHLLTEKHIFWRKLPSQLRSTAAAMGLATRKWSKGNYKGLGKAGSDARWDRLERMAQVDETAALLSASYAKPQIMGFNYKLCGYHSVKNFVVALASSEAAQDKAFIDFLLNSGLADDIRAKDVRAIVRRYNGSGQVDYYSRKVSRAYESLTGHALQLEGSSKRAGMLRLGASGQPIETFQLRLSDLGYHVNPDGDFGDATRRAVVAFQVDHGLKPDGLVGPKTAAMIKRAVPLSEQVTNSRQDLRVKDLRAKGSQTVKQADRLTVLGGGVVATGGVAKAAELVPDSSILDQLSGLQDVIWPLKNALSPVLDLIGSNKWLMVAAGGAAVLYVAYQIKQRRLSDAKSWRHVG
ncbi:N-acetylmuramidase domain-containing protein [Pseudovibrio sp. Tun.PSC04-5.I4]|uniref:N-acetylmuramidase domain-containing protein n=1 Tax=Pseudovibrio sp. Tun.PSC04-5.I4 TaxID=1798213 RepID=UPI0008887547|nr:N-acetylmuramidase domain-containing protein [Pseudovibrio sp. Tun.PSC04-5.I4]SDR07924.1 Putative peptidoglycan binding domain-containing protein [Pseudovibrio sp. Tun.PSC04-5.I4]